MKISYTKFYYILLLVLLYSVNCFSQYLGFGIIRKHFVDELPSDIRIFWSIDSATKYPLIKKAIIITSIDEIEHGQIESVINLTGIEIYLDTVIPLTPFLKTILKNNPNLKYLSFKGNCIKYFPKVLTQFKNLIHLSLISCNFMLLPDNIGDLNKLESLSIIDPTYYLNKYLILPKSLKKANELKNIRIEYTNLREFSSKNINIKNLKKIFLDCKKIKKIEIVRPTKLERFTLIIEKYHKLTINMSNTNNINYIYIDFPTSSTKLNNIIENLNGNKDLTTITINSKYNYVPKDLFKISSLKSLTLYDTKINKVISFKSLRNLEILLLKNCKIQNDDFNYLKSIIKYVHQD